MRDFSVLSDVEFEELVGDLFGATFDTTVERFAAGADGGTDLRWALSGKTYIAQCKHYNRSSFSQLMHSAKKELAKVQKLSPAGYKFVTTFDLSVSQKEQLYSTFAQWMTDPSDVLGGRDVDALITRFQEVERRHPKLWVSTGMQLFWNLHSDIANRTEALRHRIEKSMPKYVVSSSYAGARQLLEEHNVCLISGPPGIGKTILAQMLLAEYISSGYEPIEVSSEIDEAWTSLSHDTRQVFLYDDFLGEITFSERLAKNEDKRLSNLIEKLSGKQSKKKLILTTREYILRDAQLSYERLSELDSKYRFVLELQSYTKSDRAQILYSHLWHSNVGATCLREISQGGYKDIINHAAYSPRLVEYCTGGAFDKDSPGYPRRFKAMLDNPERIWRRAFDKHLTLEQRLLVLVLCTLPRVSNYDVLQEAHASLCEQFGVISTDGSYRETLEVLEGTFISISKDNTGATNVRHANPSVTEFALSIITEDQKLLKAVIHAASFFEQLIELFRYGVGGSFFHPGNPKLMSALRRIRSDFNSAMDARFKSPSSQRWAAQFGQTDLFILAELAGKFESRVGFYLQVDEEWGINSETIKERINYLISRWRRHEGDKSEAFDVFEAIAKHELPGGLRDEAHSAFHGWLEDTLEETDDWHQYAKHLADHDGVDLGSESHLAERFEEFIEGEFRRSSPGPSNPDEMKSLADDFGLDDLADRLEEVLQDGYEPDDDYERHRSTGGAEEKGSDAYIEDLFGRLSDS